MSAKHTPGQWEIHETPWAKNAKHFSVFCTGPSRAYMICSMVAQPNHLEQAEANARLIAAAPELLEALEAAETALIKDMEDPEGFNWEQSGLLPKIRAAIAKARQ